MERKLHFRENWLIFFWICVEAKLILRIWGAKEKYFQGAEVFSFRDLGRSMHYLQGSREHRPPWGAHQCAASMRQKCSQCVVLKFLNKRLASPPRKKSVTRFYLYGYGPAPVSSHFQRSIYLIWLANCDQISCISSLGSIRERLH